MRIERDQLNGSDVTMRSVCLEFFPAQHTEEVVLECSVSEELWTELRDLVREATPPQLEGSSPFDVAQLAGQPYHATLKEHPQPARKYILHDVQCGDFKIGVWCKLSSASLPSFYGAMLKVSSFSHTLEIGGARIKLPRQRFFSSARPFEGSLEALANILLEKYKPFISKSWRSILNNSNVVLGGFFSRYTWAPRQRTVELPKPSSMLYLQNGAVKLREEAARSMKVETGPYRLDESGFESALRSRSKKQVELFVRELTEMLGARVRDSRRLAQYCESLLGARETSLDQVVEFLTGEGQSTGILDANPRGVPFV
ncbi:MRL1 [Symbiodinium pilosum]|uniref:MRL1 protein n=1 Tax=Symbiodinium pilosum TaxID=2952 RepID=A0A812X6X8_SYMPI|nr:MRL1 [Symbiodinium pilosum]